MKAPENAPDNFTYNDTEEKEFKELAHKNGLTGNQAGAIWDMLVNKAVGMHQDAVTQKQTYLNEGHQALKKEWGAAYDDKLKIANQVVTKFGGEDTIKWLRSTGLSQDPHMIKMAVNVASAISEDKIVESSGPSAKITPKEALSQINAIKDDTSHPYHNIKAAGHQEAVKKMEELYALAYPE